MRILFVIPPYRTTDTLVAQLYPMPLAAVSLGAILKAGGHVVSVKDFLVPEQVSSCESPASFRNKHAPAYRHYGVPLDEACQWVRDHAGEYDAVGLCGGQCNIWETVQQISKAVKDAGVPLVVGGPFASTAPEQVQAITRADVVVVGQGEAVVERAFADAVSGNVGMITGPHVDPADYPLPDWTLCPPVNYPKYGGRVRGVLTVSRGCPHQCTFCSVHTIAGRRHYRADREGVKNQLKNLWQHGVRYFSFLDDNLFLNQSAVESVLGAIEELDRELPGFKQCRFYVEEGIEVRMAARAGFVQRVAAARFENIALGIETWNAARRGAVRKPFTEEQLRTAVYNCRAAGITPKAFYIIGLPGDTTQSVCRDLFEFGKIGISARPNNLKLYPGTEVTRQYREAGYVGDDYDWRLSSFWTPDTPELPFASVRSLKTMLGAIGNSADAFGIAVFADTIEAVGEKLLAKNYRLERGPEQWTLTGNFFRATPYRHMMELLILASGAAGAATDMPDNKTIVARVLSAPANEIQAALAAAVGGIEYAREEIIPAGAGGPVAICDPEWRVGDATKIDQDAPGEYDFLFSCPPYGDLEQYSEDPADLSNMDWKEFLLAYRAAIAKATAMLKDNRFACFVVGDFRDGRGVYRNFVSETIRAFLDAGLALYNEAIFVTPLGSLPVRAGRVFQSSRKLGKTHQNVLVFVKGDPALATAAVGPVEFGEVEPEPEETEIAQEAQEQSS